MAESIGIVVIGRNEGERLKRCLESIKDWPAVVYVDSGSTDGSVEHAQQSGVLVHELDAATPFSAARGRQEGFFKAMSRWPELEYVQFIDGDCILDPGWLETARTFFDDSPHIGIVTGAVQEADAQTTIYARVSPLRWRQPTGEVNACGGIFMIRRSVFENVGGFDVRLLTREESDLCARIRKSGYRIVRLDRSMAAHESGFQSLGPWLGRAVWGGYGDARMVVATWPAAESIRRLLWYIVWALGIHVMMFACVVAMYFHWVFVCGLFVSGIGFAIHVAKWTRARRHEGDSWQHSFEYAGMMWIRNLACGYGFVKYALSGGGHTSTPDPRAMAEAPRSRKCRDPRALGSSQ